MIGVIHICQESHLLLVDCQFVFFSFGDLLLPVSFIGLAQTPTTLLDTQQPVYSFNAEHRKLYLIIWYCTFTQDSLEKISPFILNGRRRTLCLALKCNLKPCYSMFSSPEPKAHKVSLKYTNGPSSVRRCPSVAAVRRRPHFQTWISLKPVGQSWSSFICSIIGVGENAA